MILSADRVTCTKILETYSCADITCLYEFDRVLVI